MKILLSGNLAQQGAPLLRRHFGETIDLLEQDAAAAADVLITLAFDERGPAMPKLRLIQLPVAGLDQVSLAAVPPGVPVCNVFEHELGMAEYVMAAMLHLTVDLAARHARFRAGSWADSPLQGGPPRRELAGQTLGCLGYGHIGRAVALRARAFGMRIMALTGSGDVGEPTPDWSGGPAGLDHLLEAADFLLVACPLTAATRGLIGAPQLARMKPEATLINVARGAIVDEQALFDALRERRIGGAVLDTWYRYPSAEAPAPRPSDLPFHELDNLLMTPHCSGWSEGLMTRRFALIADNLERLRDGRPLRNQVHPPTA